MLFFLSLGIPAAARSVARATAAVAAAASSAALKPHPGGT